MSPKILFLCNREHGAANVHLAAAYNILTDYPEIEVHLASFPPLETHVSTISSQAMNACKKIPGPRPIIFHPLSGPCITESIQEQAQLQKPGVTFDEIVTSAPGISGAVESYRALALFSATWTAEQHIQIYDEFLRIIQTVDPGVVVIDPMCAPATEATRKLGRKHVVLCPSALKDHLGSLQPWGKFLWKFPILSSGYPYPLPWYLILANIYLFIRLIMIMVFSPEIRRKNKTLKALGHPPSEAGLRLSLTDKTPWLFPSFPEIDFPLDMIPDHVVPCGPIIMHFAPVEETDAELAEWIAGGRTVVINLGTLYNYDAHSAREMAGAIRVLLEKHRDVRVLWKLKMRRQSPSEDRDGFGKEADAILSEVLGEEIKTGRVRASKWIGPPPAAILRTPGVVCSVHHGGANSYHEAIAAGVPHIVLPFWHDLYDFANRVEFLGIGLWGSHKAAPVWETEVLSDALLKVVGDSEMARSMRRRAKELQELCRGREEGRRFAARKIVEMAQ